MSKVLRVHSTLGPLKTHNLLDPSRQLARPPLQTQSYAISGAKTLPLSKSYRTLPQKICLSRRRILGFSALTQEDHLQEHDDSPVSVELKPISSESEFDRVIADAQQLDEPVIMVWMASWCRKCVYLKPKLEKLAADYYPRLGFYCVDVNKVPHRLVARAGVTKMPTIQLWKDGEKQGEVIGGHKAYLVINEVREMIENEDTT